MTYSGRNDGWTFSPPYLAALRIRGGTNRPKETAITRFMEDGGYGVRIRVSFMWAVVVPRIR